MNLVWPSFVLCESLTHNSSGFSFLIPNLYKIVRASRKNESLRRLINKRNISYAITVSSNLQFLPNISRRDDVVGLMMSEVMSIGWVLSSAYIVIVLDPVRILIANHIGRNRLDFLVPYEVGNINNSDVAKLVSQNELAFDVLIVLLGVIGRDEGNLGWLLDAVHILPLGEQFVPVLVEVFSRK